ncbi:hypothetical protein WN51_07487 [Melipona quadrifasciata]|uniref:Uncharacterized protein n=1 Tax=Melipona quadrifasciata TaxID=166423 RepID=A0A0M9A8H5_9HYME|nr:hypothetical protein WN51_07487 [Melipona quadrifasciata]
MPPVVTATVSGGGKYITPLKIFLDFNKFDLQSVIICNIRTSSEFLLTSGLSSGIKYSDLCNSLQQRYTTFLTFSVLFQQTLLRLSLREQGNVNEMSTELLTKLGYKKPSHPKKVIPAKSDEGKILPPDMPFKNFETNAPQPLESKSHPNTEEFLNGATSAPSVASCRSVHWLEKLIDLFVSNKWPGFVYQSYKMRGFRE